ncbi:MAG: PilZ domain-containing protein [Myxococcota bacterium]
MISLGGDKAQKEQGSEELVRELEKNLAEAVESQRASTRHDIRASVDVEPASLSMRDGSRLRGVTGDVSAGGCLLLLGRPLMVGDVYRLVFDRSEFDVAPAFALCVRARQVQPDAFEMGCRFLESVTLPSAPAGEKGALL